MKNFFRQKPEKYVAEIRNKKKTVVVKGMVENAKHGGCKEMK